MAGESAEQDLLQSLGTDAAAAAAPTGGAGLRGWLSGLFSATRGLADSVASTVGATAPAANAILATTGNLAGGTYRVEVSTEQRGTIDTVGNGANLRLRNNAVQVALLPSGGARKHTFVITVANATAVDVQVVGAAGAASVYVATIVATRIA